MTTQEGITKAVERAVRCGVTHLRSTPVVECIGGEVVWEGVVEEFSVWMPPPQIVYGWAVDASPEPRFIAVYATEQINSPLTALRTWLASQMQK